MWIRRIAALALLCGCLVARADEYPSRPVKVVVPFPAGSVTDAIGREVAQILARAFGKPFVVDNRPGAQATVGAAEVARASADGYTLLIGGTTSQSAARSLFRQLPYDPDKDFTPVARVGAVVSTLVVRAELPVATTLQLIAHGRRNPGKLNWGYANAANRVAGAAIARQGGFEAAGVPYRGVPQIIVDLISGQLDYAVVDLTNAVPHVRSGKLKALAVTAGTEVSLLPGVPPLSDALSGFQLLGWFGLFGPAGMPADVVAALSATLLRGLDDPAVRQRIEGAGLIAFPASADELRQFVASEAAKWERLTREAGVQPE